MQYKSFVQHWKNQGHDWETLDTVHIKVTSAHRVESRTTQGSDVKHTTAQSRKIRTAFCHNNKQDRYATHIRGSISKIILRLSYFEFTESYLSTVSFRQLVAKSHSLLLNKNWRKQLTIPPQRHDNPRNKFLMTTVSLKKAAGWKYAYTESMIFGVVTVWFLVS